MKVIEIKKNGYVWHVDLEHVAKNRAKYYAGNDEAEYKEEFDFVMSDDYEGIDWYQNNMNWSDVPDSAKRLVKSRKPPESPDDIDDEDNEFEIDIIEVAA